MSDFRVFSFSFHVGLSSVASRRCRQSCHGHAGWKGVERLPNRLVLTGPLGLGRLLWAGLACARLVLYPPSVEVRGDRCKYLCSLVLGGRGHPGASGLVVWERSRKQNLRSTCKTKTAFWLISQRQSESTGTHPNFAFLNAPTLQAPKHPDDPDPRAQSLSLSVSLSISRN